MKAGEQFWGARVDERRFALCVAPKLWMVLLAALLVALLGGGVYAAWRLLTAGPARYRAESLYAIQYDLQEDDEVLKEFINEYNAYTWGDMMRSDRVAAQVAQALPSLTRQQVEDCLDTGIASDPEFLSVGFSAGDPETANQLQDAYDREMVAFGRTMKGRGLSGIEVWKSEPAQKVAEPNRLPNAMILGAVLGLIAGILGLACRYVLDDRIFVEGDLSGVKVLGYRTNRPGSIWDRQREENFSYLARRGLEGSLCVLSCGEILEDAVDWDRLRRQKERLILSVRFGHTGAREFARAVGQAVCQDVPVAGAFIDGADAGFLRRYYGNAAGEGNAGNAASAGGAGNAASAGNEGNTGRVGDAGSTAGKGKAG